ncbi:MAG: isocitrate/isopropylmalate family dehydrogenase [Acidimicrobiales bacterium]
MITIALLPGDGVGEEVLAGPIRIARWLEDHGHLRCTGPWPLGASSYGASGDLSPESTLAACDDADALLLGAVGDHPGVDLTGVRPELALIGLRERYDLRVSIRQVWRGTEAPLTFVRNLLGGAYAAASKRQESDGTGPASDLFELEPDRIRELAEIALGYIRRSPSAELVSVDKANLLATSRLWRRVVSEVAEAADAPVRHVYVDRMAFELGSLDCPESVILTEGLFGDILSDLASGRAGSIAMCSSASVNPHPPSGSRCAGLFEPVHGSAPRRAGRDQVNPIGGYLALTALLDWFPETAKWAPLVRDALAVAVANGPLTYDMAPAGTTPVATSEFSARVDDAFWQLAEGAG